MALRAKDIAEMLGVSTATVSLVLNNKPGLGGFLMLKIRLQGTTNDIKWFQKILQRDKRINVLEMSERYANKGTKKYFRVYAEVEKAVRPEQ